MSEVEYTPTTAEVRDDYENGRWNDGVGPSGTGPEFDRWLAEHDQHVAAETLTDMADEWQAIEPIDSIGRFWRDIFAGKLRASIGQTEGN